MGWSHGRADNSVNEDENDESEDDEADGDDDVKMDEDENKPKVKSSDPSDMSAFKMDEYDEEESGGVGEPILLLDTGHER